MAHPTEQTEAKIHKIFDFTLLLKGAHAAIEIIGGILLYIISPATIARVASFFTHGEMIEDPHDTIATFFLHTAQSLGGSSRTFAALYLLSHGIINALVVVSLWKEKLWAYPISIATLVAFMAYQIYLLTFGYSIWLVLFTILDAVIIWLVLHEYGVLKKKKGK